MTGSETAWKTSDGKSFKTEADAQAHADQAKPTVSFETTWRTSDGRCFSTEAEARDHAQQASVTVKVTGSEASKVEHPAQTHEEAVEETGHWELVAITQAGGQGRAEPSGTPEAKPSDGDDRQQATQKLSGDKAQSAPDEEAEPVALEADAHAKPQQAKALPQTGDSETRIGVVTAAALGSVAVFGAAAHLRRKGL